MLSSAPAFADVGTLCLLADGGQLKLPQLFLDTAEILPHRDLRLQPGWQPEPFIFTLLPAEFALVGGPFFLLVRWVLHKVLETGSTFQPFTDLLQRIGCRVFALDGIL